MTHSKESLGSEPPNQFLTVTSEIKFRKFARGETRLPASCAYACVRSRGTRVYACVVSTR